MYATLQTNNPTLTLNELAIMFDLAYMLTQCLVTEKLDYSRICAKWVLKLLTESQKKGQVGISQLWE